MPQFATVGWYDDRAKAALWTDKEAVSTLTVQRPQRLRYELMDGYLVFTDPDAPSFGRAMDQYLGGEV